MKQISRLLQSCGILACGIGALLTWLAAGCGGEALLAKNVAVLNAELAQLEGSLAERLSGLKPEEVAEACRYMERVAEEGARAVARLPEGDASALAAQASALAQFRAGAEGLAEEVSGAVRREGVAKRGAEAALGRLKEIRAAVAGEVAPRLPEWMQTLKETSGQLEGWRRQRIEKMEHGETATFPAFHAAAKARYGAWGEWTEKAGELRDRVLGELCPAAEAASGSLEEAVAAARAVRRRAAEGIVALRAIPVSGVMAKTARDSAVDAFNGTILDAARAVDGLEKKAKGWAEVARKRAEALSARADALHGATAEGAKSPYGTYVGRDEWKTAADAVSGGRDTGRRALKSVDEFVAGLEALRGDWKPLGGELEKARGAAEEAHRMKNIDEEALARDLALIVGLKNRIAAADIAGRCTRLSRLREETESALGGAERTLENAETAWQSARTGAEARWEEAQLAEEKKELRTAMEQLIASARQPVAPGWSRPEKELGKLLADMEGFLARLDSMGREKVEAEGKKIQARVQDLLVERLKWVPGARHPEHPHIHAADEEWTWTNDPGYEFLEEGTSNLAVRWHPGAWDEKHPNVTAGQQEGTWVPNPGYVARRSGDLDPKWTPGTRHPRIPHIHAADEERTWTNDPGYEFVDMRKDSTNLSVRWKPGAGNPDHPHVTAGQAEGTWVPRIGFRARWNGDMDPVWTKGARHPDWPHVFATETERTWDADPGYVFANPGKNGDLSVVWKEGLNHPDYKGIVSARREGYWDAKEGWTFVNPGTSDLRAKWNPGVRMKGYPHVRASSTESQWTPDDGYRFRSMANDGDFSVVWSPGWTSADGKRRAGQREGHFETRRKCPNCSGTGYRQKTERCSSCAGTGMIFVLPCPDCRGQKKVTVRSRCERCQGDGWLWY